MYITYHYLLNINGFYLERDSSMKMLLSVASGQAEVIPIPNNVRIDQLLQEASLSDIEDLILSGKLTGSKTYKNIY